MKKYGTMAAIAATAAAICLSALSAYADDGSTVDITINLKGEKKAISPYIYGINEELMGGDVMPTAIRAGGNRSSAYNWETNASNAGSDRINLSDNYFQQVVGNELKDTPGAMSINLMNVCKEKNDAYALTTLQLAGYVSADMDGEVTKAQAAPSDRWYNVELVKGSAFDDTPDTSDKTVYMDEYVNYLVNTLGSASEGGIRGYSMDNEPGLWNQTHSLMHPDHATCKEVVEKCITMAKAVKEIDPDAEIFGPALFGYSAFNNLAGAPDWGEEKSWNADYRWYIDYYLDRMRQAEEESGTRLLDVLDVHYYTEAKGPCGERSCKHYSKEECVQERFNSVRSLWDDTYEEDSWITKDAGGTFFPLLNNLKQSIDEFYPGTKLGITEYDFGGSFDICGAIAEAEALMAFANNDVYFATLFAMEADYQCAAINLFTNYDGNGGSFGENLLPSETSDFERSTGYAAIDGDNTDVVTVVVTNKSFDKTTANIKLEGGDYSYVHLYGINNFAAQVFDMTDSSEAITISGDTITYEMEPETVSLLVIAKDKDSVPNNAPAQEESEVSDDSSKKEKSSSSNAGLIAGIGVASAAAVGGTIFGLRKKKKS